VLSRLAIDRQLEEHPDERAARLQNERRAAIIEDCKGIVIFAAPLLFTMIIASASLYMTLLSTNLPPETQRWYQSVLAAILSGGVAFLLGKK
jgi:hypothetical protein